MIKPIYLFVTPFFPSANNWRGEYCYDLVKSLIKTGAYDVRVFMPGLGEDYDYGGVHVCGFPIKMLPSAVLPFLYRKYNEASFLRKVASENIDMRDVAVCHINIAMLMPYAMAAKRANPKCLTINYHYDLASFGLNLGRLRHFWPHKFILFRQLRKMHDAMDIHLFISTASERNFRAAPKVPARVIYQDYIRQMRGLGWMRPARVKRSLILHLGVDVSKFKSKTDMPDVKRPFTIGCIANFQVLKDHITLLKALEQIRGKLGEWRLRLIGSGETKAMCEAYVKAHGLDKNIIFEKESHHDRLVEYYQSIDLFVLPSIFEGFGLVMSEAAACGVPFIACKYQGTDDLLKKDDQDIWLVEPRDVHGFAQKILWYYKTRERQQIVGSVCFDRIMERFVAEIKPLVVRYNAHQ